MFDFMSCVENRLSRERMETLDPITVDIHVLERLVLRQ